MYKNEDLGKVIYKELSYNIIGAIFEVYNELGYGFKERYYEELLLKSLLIKR